MRPVPCADLSRLQVYGIFILLAGVFTLFARNTYAASLTEALDSPTLIWRTSSPVPWFAESIETHDGIDAGQSGSILDGEESWIETTVTGPGPLSFWWKVSSELGYDQLQFMIDGEERINISGEVSWELRTFDLPEGAHVLRWRYVKDLTEIEGLDRGWLDQVSFFPANPFAPIISEGPVSRAVAAGATVSLSVTADALPAPTYQWFHNSMVIPMETNSVLILNNITIADAGAYTVLVHNPLGQTSSPPAILTVTIVADVVEAPELSWTIGGDESWFGQSAVTHDAIDALESGAIQHQQESWVQTRVTGPGVLSFWWKVSSEPFYDGLQFLTNSAIAASLSGEATWEQKTFNFPAGTFTLRWRYFKDSSLTIGQDKGWLDQVTWVPNKPPTNLVVTLSRQTILENDTVTLNGSFTDADVLDSHAVLVNWRDGSVTTTNFAPGVYSFSTTHHYKDDEPTGSISDNYQITVSVSDEVGSINGIYPLTVSNSPPALSSLLLTTLIFPNDTATLSGIISDIGTLDTLRLRLNWGDSTNVESFNYSPGASSFLLRHKYSIANSNAQVTLTATDDDQGVLIIRTNVMVRPLPVRARVLSIRKGTSSNSLVQLQGTVLANYQVQSSMDLVHWATIAIRTANTGGLFEVDDPGGFTYQRRFYRAIWESQSAGMRFSAISKHPNGQMAIQLIGLPGATYRVDSSTNFLNWLPLTTATMDSNGFFNFTDSSSTLRRKFYRAVLP